MKILGIVVGVCLIVLGALNGFLGVPAPWSLFVSFIGGYGGGTLIAESLHS
jgi:hypothetical protein